METVNGGDFEKGAPPPPSPLTGCYLLIVVGEPHSQEHKDIILQRIAKGLLSWNSKDCLVDLEKELTVISEQALEGEEARHGERLIQFASENLVTEILIHPVVSTLVQCMRNLLSSFTRHRHIIHAGYTFAANGSWALQDGTFSYADFSEAFQEIETQRVIHAYENGISLDLHCSSEGDWSRLPKESFCRGCNVRVNPSDVLTSGSPSITRYISYISQFLNPTSLEELLQCSDVVGNIRFSRPTLYVFPGGQGDAALFGINGFNMLLDGGFSRKACFWDFVRHLDRLDAVLMTRLNNSNIGGISSILRRKRKDAVYPQIGHFFCNIQERKTALSPDGDKDRDPLLIDLLNEGQEIISNLCHLNLNPQVCYRDQEPINLYHKVGHGTLNMYVLNPAKDSKEVKEFLQKWNQSDQKLFSKQHREISFPLQNLISVAVLLIWQPANANDTITRILYPGSSPQHKIFEGLDRIKNLEFIKHPVCSEKTLLAKIGTKKSAKDDKIFAREKPAEKKEKMIIDNNINALDIKDKQVKKADTVDNERTKAKKEDAKVNDNDEKKPKTRPSKIRNDMQQRKKSTEKKDSPTTPKKTLDQAEVRKTVTSTPAKSTKDANNRKVIENKTKSLKSVEPKPKVEKKFISRKPRSLPKAPVSPAKRVMNGVAKADGISRKGKIPDGTDSSTVSTPSADQESLKKDISSLTAEEIQRLKAEELAELEEEQEAVKEIEEVFRKGEARPVEEESLRKIKNISIDEDKSEKEEYLIIEKEDIQTDLVDEKDAKEGEFQKLTRDSEESEKQGHVVSEDKLQKQEVAEEVQKIAPIKEGVVATSDDAVVTSQEEKVEVLSSDKKSDRDVEIKDIVESQPDEKVSANIKSGDTTTAPTLPEDERIPLDEIKEDNGYPIEEKYAKEETKEKGLPVIQLPPKTFDTIAKIPGVVGIRLDKQSHIRDIVKTPDEVADLPVHEEVDYEYAQETKNELKTNDILSETLKSDNEVVKEKEIDQEKDVKFEKPHADEQVKEKEDEKKVREEKVVEEHVPAIEEVKIAEDSVKLATEKQVIDESGKEIKEHIEVSAETTKDVKKFEEEKDVDVKSEEAKDVGVTTEETKEEKLHLDAKDKDEPVDKKEIKDFAHAIVEHKEQEDADDEQPKKDELGQLPRKISFENADAETKEEKILQEVQDQKDKEKEPEVITQIIKDDQLADESKEERHKQDRDEEKKDEVEKSSIKEEIDRTIKDTKDEQLFSELIDNKEDILKEDIKLVDSKDEVMKIETDIKLKEEGKEEDKEDVSKEEELKETEIISDKEDKERVEEKEHQKDIKQEQPFKIQDKEDASEEKTNIKEQRIEEAATIVEQIEKKVTPASTKEEDHKEVTEEKLSFETKELSITEKKLDSPLESDESKEDVVVEEKKIEAEFPTVEQIKDDEDVENETEKHKEEVQQDKVIHKPDSKEELISKNKEEQRDKSDVHLKDETKEERAIKDSVEENLLIRSTTEIKHGLEHEKELRDEKVEEKHVSKREIHLEQEIPEKEIDHKQIKTETGTEVDFLEEKIKDTETKLEIEKDKKLFEEIKEFEAHKEGDKEVIADKGEDIDKKTVESVLPEKKEEKEKRELHEDEKIEISQTIEEKTLGELKDKEETNKDNTTSLDREEEKEQVKKVELKSSKFEEKVEQTLVEKSDLGHDKDISNEKDKIEIGSGIETDSSDTKIPTPEQKDSKRSSIVEEEDIKSHIKPAELGERRSSEREECVIKIVASVAEVLKSDAPLEEFEGKLPISFETCKPTFIAELRETHITTMDHEEDDIDVKISLISTVPEEASITSTIDEKDSTDSSEIDELVKQSADLMAASFIANALDDGEEQNTVQRMLVTASSEDGGEEIEICPVGSITFSKSSESSGRSSPEKSLESKKSSIIDTISDSVATVKQVSEEHSDKDSDIDGTVSTKDGLGKKDALLEDKTLPSTDIQEESHKAEEFKGETKSQIKTMAEAKTDVTKEQQKLLSDVTPSQEIEEIQSDINVSGHGKEVEEKEKTTSVRTDKDEDSKAKISEKEDLSSTTKPLGDDEIKEHTAITEDVSVKDTTFDEGKDKEKRLSIDTKNIPISESEKKDIVDTTDETPAEKTVEDLHKTEEKSTTADNLPKISSEYKKDEVISKISSDDKDFKKQLPDLPDMSVPEKKEPIHGDKTSEAESEHREPISADLIRKASEDITEKGIELTSEADKANEETTGKVSLLQKDSDIEETEVVEKAKSADVGVKKEEEKVKEVEEKIESVSHILPKSEEDIILKDSLVKTDSVIEKRDTDDKSPSDILDKEEIKILPDTQDLTKPVSQTKDLKEEDKHSTPIEEKSEVHIKKEIEDIPDLKDLSRSMIEAEKSIDLITKPPTEGKIESALDSVKPKEEISLKESVLKEDKEIEKRDVSRKSSTEIDTKELVKDLASSKGSSKPPSEVSTDDEVESAVDADKFKEHIPDLKDLSKPISEKHKSDDLVKEAEKSDDLIKESEEKQIKELNLVKSKDDAIVKESILKTETEVKTTDVREKLSTDSDKEVGSLEAEKISGVEGLLKEEVNEISTVKEIESVLDQIKIKEDDHTKDTEKADLPEKSEPVSAEVKKDEEKLLDTKDSHSLLSDIRDSDDKISESVTEKKVESVLVKEELGGALEDAKVVEFDARKTSVPDVNKDIANTKDTKLKKHDLPEEITKLDEKDEKCDIGNKRASIVDGLGAHGEDLMKDSYSEVLDTTDSLNKIGKIDKSKEDSATTEELSKFDGKDHKILETLSHSVIEEQPLNGRSSEPISGKIFEAELDKSVIKEDVEETLEKIKSVKDSDILSEKVSFTDQVSDTLSSTLSSDSSTDDKSSSEVKKLPESVITSSDSMFSDSIHQKVTEPETPQKTGEHQGLALLETSSEVDVKDIKSKYLDQKTDHSSDELLLKKEPSSVDSALKTDDVRRDIETSDTPMKEDIIKDVTCLEKDIRSLTPDSEAHVKKTEVKLEKDDSTKYVGLPKPVSVEEKADIEIGKLIEPELKSKISSTEKSEPDFYDKHIKPEESLIKKIDEEKVDSSSFNGYGHKFDDFDHPLSMDKSMTTSIYETADVEKHFEPSKDTKQLPHQTDIGLFIESERQASAIADHKKDSISEPSKSTTTIRDFAKEFGETSSGSSSEQHKDLGAISDRGEEFKKDLFHDRYASGGITPPTAPVSPAISETYGTELKSSIKDTEKILSSDHENIECTTSDSTTEDIYTMLRNKKLMTGEGLMSESFYGALPDQMSLGSEEIQAEASYGFGVKEKSEKIEGGGYKDSDEKEKEKISLKTDTKDVSSKYETKSEKEISEASSKEGSKPGSPSLLELEGPRSHLYEITKAKDFTKSTVGKESEEHPPSHSSGGQFHAAKDEADPIAPWGKPLGLPSPAPTSDNRGTPKKERKLPLNVSVKNKWNDDKKRSESPSKNKNKRVCPIYVDLTYVPHHGNSYYSYVDFFKTVRARYYVFSGIEPGREVYNALLEAKQTWENKDLEVTIIPTYDTDILGYWVSENEELLTKFKIDLSPSASRCTINLQDHETSCSAYRLEF